MKKMMTTTMNLKVSGLALALALISGCASLGPNEAASQLPQLPDSYSVQLEQTDKTLADYVNWPSLYEDPVLAQIVDQALNGVTGSSLDVAKAWAQYEQGVATVKAAKASLWPILSAQGSAQRTGSEPQVNSPKQAGLNAQMELDVAGKLRAHARAASLEGMGKEKAWEQARKSVQLGIVTQYWLLRQLDAEIDFVGSLIKARLQLIDITQSRIEFGTATDMQLHQAEASLANAQRQAVTLQAQRDRVEQSLALLIGDPQFQVPFRPNDEGKGVEVNSTILPLLLLTNRSDVQMAEYRMQAANMNVQGARAALFPSISLSAAAARHGGSVGELANGGLTQWGWSVNIDVPLFDRGYRLSQIELARAVERERLVDYQKAILTGFTEVNQALIDLAMLNEAKPLIESEVQAARTAYDMALLQYENGLVGYPDLLNAQQAYDEASRSEVRLAYELRTAQGLALAAMGF